jgi:gluconolactonase
VADAKEAATEPPSETWLEPAGYEGPGQETWAPNLQEPGTNGMIRARGGLMVADQGNRSIALIDLDTRAKTQLATHFEGKRFNSPNDMVPPEGHGLLHRPTIRPQQHLQ